MEEEVEKLEQSGEGKEELKGSTEKDEQRWRRKSRVKGRKN